MPRLHRNEGKEFIDKYREKAKVIASVGPVELSNIMELSITGHVLSNGQDNLTSLDSVAEKKQMGGT